VSVTRLLVLGVVRMYGQAHGYQVRTALASWSADRWANAKPGSIYHALKKLAAEGLLDPVGTEEGAGGPDRTIYRLTPTGDLEFLTLLRTALTDRETGPAAIFAAATFLPALSRREAVALLRVRRRQADVSTTMAGEMRDANAEMGKPAHVAELFALWAEQGLGELRWLDALIAKLEAGEYVLADDSPDHFAALRD
jgi:DNA-binding PadR family transcriptional regulator